MSSPPPDGRIFFSVFFLIFVVLLVCFLFCCRNELAWSESSVLVFPSEDRKFKERALFSSGYLQKSMPDLAVYGDSYPPTGEWSSDLHTLAVDANRCFRSFDR